MNSNPLDARPAGLQGLGGRTEEPSAALRCFVYCRKSTDDESRQVASIQSQRETLEAAFGAHPDLNILDIYEEARSAKTLGRPIFAEMLSRIERGEANCIIAWAPDRLARNSIDGGRIIYLLDTGVLRDLKFSTYTFENNSQGKFMLSIMFGQSKYYSDSLSDNVKRGNRTKASSGWRPGAAPLGYLNDRAARTIAIDPVYFPVVRRMFDMVLCGGYSARQIARTARDEWKLTTPKRRGGGNPVHVSMVHRLLTNPFYAGLFVWEGQMLEGKHTPVVSLDEFRAVQQAIRRRPGSVQRRQSFPFRHLIRCGLCGHTMSGQRNVNRYGTWYAYYICTYVGPAGRCPRTAIRAEDLERQIADWLSTISPESAVASRIVGAVDAVRSRASAAAHAIRESVDRALRETQAQLSELTSLRLRRLLDDEEFLRRREALQKEAVRLARRLDELAKPEEVLKPIEDGLAFSNSAADWFRHADDELKRIIVKAASSNLTLVDKKLSAEAAKWLQWMSVLWRCPIGLRVGDTKANPDAMDDELLRLADEFQSDPERAAQLAAVRHVVSAMTNGLSPRLDDISAIDTRRKKAA